MKKTIFKDVLGASDAEIAKLAKISAKTQASNPDSLKEDIESDEVRLLLEFRGKIQHVMGKDKDTAEKILFDQLGIEEGAKYSAHELEKRYFNRATIASLPFSNRSSFSPAEMTEASEYLAKESPQFIDAFGEYIRHLQPYEAPYKSLPDLIDRSMKPINHNKLTAASVASLFATAEKAHLVCEPIDLLQFTDLFGTDPTKAKMVVDKLRDLDKAIPNANYTGSHNTVVAFKNLLPIFDGKVARFFHWAEAFSTELETNPSVENLDISIEPALVNVVRGLDYKSQSDFLKGILQAIQYNLELSRKITENTEYQRGPKIVKCKDLFDTITKVAHTFIRGGEFDRKAFHQIIHTWTETQDKLAEKTKDIPLLQSDLFDFSKVKTLDDFEAEATKVFQSIKPAKKTPAPEASPMRDN